MNPQLIENNIKHIIHNELLICKERKFEQNTLILNVSCLVFILGTITYVLCLMYKGKQDVETRNKKEQDKREYILNKLRIYEKIKTQDYTNIPV